MVLFRILVPEYLILLSFKLKERTQMNSITLIDLKRYKKSLQQSEVNPVEIFSILDVDEKLVVYLLFQVNYPKRAQYYQQNNTF